MLNWKQNHGVDPQPAGVFMVIGHIFFGQGIPWDRLGAAF